MSDNESSVTINDLIAWRLKQKLEAAQTEQEYELRLALQDLYHTGKIDVLMESGEMKFQYRCDDLANTQTEDSNIVETSLSETSNAHVINWFGEDEDE